MKNHEKRTLVVLPIYQPLYVNVYKIVQLPPPTILFLFRTKKRSKALVLTLQKTSFLRCEIATVHDKINVNDIQR